MRVRFPKTNVLLEICLAFFVCWQVVIVLTGYAIPWAKEIWALRHTSSFVRSGTFEVSMGKDPTGYVLFLRDRIPEDGIVIVPARALIGTLRKPFLVQYFLFPREIIACSKADITPCLPGVDLSRTYVLYCGKEDPAASLQHRFVFASYRPACGVYTPLAPVTSPPHPEAAGD